MCVGVGVKVRKQELWEGEEGKGTSQLCPKTTTCVGAKGDKCGGTYKGKAVKGGKGNGKGEGGGGTRGILQWGWATRARQQTRAINWGKSPPIQSQPLNCPVLSRPCPNLGI